MIGQGNEVPEIIEQTFRPWAKPNKKITDAIEAAGRGNDAQLFLLLISIDPQLAAYLIARLKPPTMGQPRKTAQKKYQTLAKKDRDVAAVLANHIKQSNGGSRVVAATEAIRFLQSRFRGKFRSVTPQDAVARMDRVKQYRLQSLVPHLYGAISSLVAD
jgi:hypothetical protein